MEGENLVITATTARGQIKRTFSFSEDGMILVRNNNTRFETLNFHFSGFRYKCDECDFASKCPASLSDHNNSAHKGRD